MKIACDAQGHLSLNLTLAEAEMLRRYLRSEPCLDRVLIDLRRRLDNDEPSPSMSVEGGTKRVTMSRNGQKQLPVTNCQLPAEQKTEVKHG